MPPSGPASAAAPGLPWLQRAEVQRIVWPAAVGVGLLTLWQALVVGLDVPPFLVPSPLRVAEVMVIDAALLFGALLNTLKITLLAFFCATALGVPPCAPPSRAAPEATSPAPRESSESFSFSYSFSFSPTRGLAITNRTRDYEKEQENENESKTDNFLMLYSNISLSSC